MDKVKGRDVFAALKKSGYRLTKARKNRINFILQKKGHWTIQDLGDDIRKKLPKVGIATLYRTVSLLLKQSLVVETRFGGASARYEVSHHHHDHLTCVTCGEIFEFENDEIEKLQSDIAKKLGFRLADHRMELFGECVRTSCKFRGKQRANSVTLRQKTAGRV
jgi:Fur family ferric uptake transcriptional regulator